MKLKLDENIDPRAVKMLTGAGHDVMTVSGEGLGGARDIDIANAVHREQSCLITLDLHFANVFAYPPEKYRGIVVLRHPHPRVQWLLKLVEQFVLLIRTQNPEKQLWIVEPGRLRIHEEMRNE